jgi:hypothetical protein
MQISTNAVTEVHVHMNNVKAKGPVVWLKWSGSMLA